MEEKDEEGGIDSMSILRRWGGKNQKMGIGDLYIVDGTY